MARLFDDANSDRLTNYSLLGITDYPFSFAAWFNADADVDNAIIVFGGETGRRWIGIWAVAGGTLRTTTYVGSGTTNTNASTGWTVGVSHHVAGVWVSDTERYVWIDGGSKGASTTERNFDTINKFHIGCANYVYDPKYPSGKIWEAGVWNIAFSDDDVVSLANGGVPPLVRPQGLVAYYPLLRDIKDYGGSGYDLSDTTGDTVVAPHGRMIYPARTHIGVPTVSVPSVKPYWYYQRNKMRRAC